MKKDLLFWNVDTQVDFIEPDGKLYAPGAEKIKPILKKLTETAKGNEIQVVNTADFHYPDSAELSDDPDFVKTFPEHCMANTPGAEYVKETQPENPLIFDWDKEYLTLNEVKTRRNIVIRKDAFDVFAGSPHADKIVELIAPEKVVVYGVTTNVCVNDAVIGLSNRVKEVYVVEDAIKELPNIPLPFENWKKREVKMIKFEDIKDLI
jgi:nicotinamidase/pyrazinamidase